MPITEIIKEIDAYLSVLRQARDLLSTPILTVQPKVSPRENKKIKIASKLYPLGGEPVIHKSKSKSGQPIAARGLAGAPVDSIAKAPVAHDPPTPEQPPPPAVPPIPVLETKRDVLLPKRQPPATRRVRRSISKPVIRTKPDVPKPAIALAGSQGLKVVVVSADQLKQERERVVPAEVRPQRRPSAGMTGRLAFEALFKDSTDPVKP